MYFIPIEVGGYDALSNLGAPLGTRAHRAQIICPRGRLNAARGTLGYDALSNLSAPVGTRAHRATWAHCALNCWTWHEGPYSLQLSQDRMAWPFLCSRLRSPPYYNTKAEKFWRYQYPTVWVSRSHFILIRISFHFLAEGQYQFLLLFYVPRPACRSFGMGTKDRLWSNLFHSCAEGQILYYFSLLVMTSWESMALLIHRGVAV